MSAAVDLAYSASLAGIINYLGTAAEKQIFSRAKAAGGTDAIYKKFISRSLSPASILVLYFSLSLFFCRPRERAHH